jgi:hypothetical protein
MQKRMLVGLFVALSVCGAAQGKPKELPECDRPTPDYSKEPRAVCVTENNKLKCKYTVMLDCAWWVWATPGTPPDPPDIYVKPKKGTECEQVSQACLPVVVNVPGRKTKSACIGASKKCWWLR